MSINLQNVTDTEDKPLTRADVERLLQEVGSPEMLNLSGQNLNGIDLVEFNLTRSNLSGANLGGANLRDAILSQANLQHTDLRQADLVRSNLSGADLHRANLFGANLGLTNLSGADLSEAYLPTASLRRANLSRANLHNANLLFANLNEADLRWANLQGADFNSASLEGANLGGAYISKSEREQLRARGVIGLDRPSEETEDTSSILRIRITEEPLTAHNLSTIISALTELSTKFWLITKDRFGDLIEYTQTHNGRFAEEAHIVVTKISYNSPMNIGWKVDVSATNVAEALVTVIDGISQVGKKLEKADLDIQAKAQEIKQAIQKATQEQQATLLEREKQRLEIELQRLEVLEKRLEVQKKGIEYALDIAGKVVDTLHPGADLVSRAMEIQALLPNLIQLQNGKGLELALPTENAEISTLQGK